MVRRWQKDADGVRNFVSPRVGIHAALWIDLNTCRPVYSLLQSLYFLV
jgi:hypothetical protein